MSDISYAPFLTPFASPALGRIDASALGQAGQLLSEGVRREQERKDRLAEQQRRFELDQSEAAGKSDYYAAQAQTHRMAVEQSKNAATEKRAQALFDAFRKSKTPQERQAVRDELQRLGFSVEETDTELPDPTAAATPAEAIASTTKAPAVAGTKVRTPKVSKKFASALGQFMTDENEATVAPEEQSPASPFADPSGVAATTMGAMPSAAPAVPKASRGGRFVIRDKSGIQVSAYDEPAERARSQSFMRQALEARGLAATTDRERRAVDAAVVAGSNAMDLLNDPNQALKHAEDTYHRTLQQEFRPAKAGTAGAGGGGGGLGKEQRMRLGGMSDDESKIIDQVARDGKIQEVSKAGLHIQRGLDLLKGDRSGFRDTQAMAELLREMSGLAVTEQEYNRTVGGNGFKTLVEKALSFYTSTGKLPDETIRELQEVFTRAMNSYKTAKTAMGQKAYDQVKRRLLTGTPEEREAQADAARGYFTDEYSDASGGAAKPAAGGGAPKSKQDELKDFLKGP